jgi:hypothetical protein
MTFEEKQQLALKFLSILGKPDADVVRELAVQDVIIWTFPGSNPHSARGPALHYLSPRFRALALFSRRHHSAWLDRRARRLKKPAQQRKFVSICISDPAARARPDEAAQVHIAE